MALNAIARHLACVLPLVSLAGPAVAQTKLLRYPRRARRRARVLLRRRPLARAGRGRHRDPADRAPRPRAVREVLARTASGSRSRASTTATSRSTWCRDGRRAEAAHVLSRRAGPSPAQGLRQPGLRLDARRQVDRCSARCATRTAGAVETALYTVDADGGLPVRAAHADVGRGRLRRPTASGVVYSPLSRDFRTWKRYQGGWAQDLYVYDLATAALTPVAQTRRTERDPMWIGERIYFVSDRDGTLNLYSSDAAGAAVEQLTNEHQLGRALGQLGQQGTHRVRAGRRAARLRRGVEAGPAARPSPCPTTALTVAALARLGREADRGRSRSRPRASARCSSRAATCSRRRSRRARRAT